MIIYFFLFISEDSTIILETLARLAVCMSCHLFNLNRCHNCLTGHLGRLN